MESCDKHSTIVNKLSLVLQPSFDKQGRKLCFWLYTHYGCMQKLYLIMMHFSSCTEFDMGLLEKKLKQQKEQRERAKKPRKKQEYTPVEVDTGLDDERGGFENDGEEPAMKIKKIKPLPVPPTKKPGSKSPSATRQSPPVEASPKPLPKLPGASKKKASTLGRGRNTGFTLMQELASKKGKPSKSSDSEGGDQSPPSKTTSMSAISSLSQDSGAGVCEPLYANTAQPKAPYQNMEFNGPPNAGPGSAGASKKTFPPTATKPPTSTSTSDLSGAGSQSEYQNINFNVKKQSPATSTKKKTRAGAHMNGSVSPKISPAMDYTPSHNTPSHHHSEPSHDNSEAVYQNTTFSRGKRH